MDLGYWVQCQRPVTELQNCPEAQSSGEGPHSFLNDCSPGAMGPGTGLKSHLPALQTANNLDFSGPL